MFLFRFVREFFNIIYGEIISAIVQFINGIPKV